jgi:hypothetical protein
MFRHLIPILFLGLIPLSLKSQDSIEYAMSSFQEIITEIASRSDEVTNFDELSNMLYDLAANPISINTATGEELEKLFWLNEFQVQSIRYYLNRYGAMVSKYELNYIPALSETEAKLLTPFLTFERNKKEPPIRPKRMLNNGHHRLILRGERVLEKQQGYTSSGDFTESNHFTGNPTSYYFRYNYRLDNRIYAGFTAEKDAGEEFFSGSNKNGFDFYSFYLQVNKVKFIKTLVVGDYRVNFGQGLAVWSGFSFGKSLSVMNSMAHNPGINYYQSVDENNFFRGTAFTLDFKPFEVSLWYSRNRMDANITNIDIMTGKVMEVSSLQTSGIHATPLDINDEDAIRSEVWGSNITYKKTNFRTGITALYYQYSAFLNPEPQPYNDYYFRGKSNYNLSVDYRYRMGNLIVFGEEALSQNGGMAALNGIQGYISGRLSLSLIGRYYQRNYQAMYGNAFGENTRINNETGVYAGFECKPFKYTSLSAYIDVFRFPWLTYSADMPSSGRDFLTQISVNPNSSLQMYLQYRNKIKETNYSGENDPKNQLCNVISQRVRFNLTYAATKYIRLRSRMELSWYNHEISGLAKGYYLGQGIEIVPGQLPVKVYLQYAFFDTDDYDSRIYAYENDLLYTFNVPAYSGKGSRAYLMVKYSLAKSVDVWLKYGITQYSNQETVGTGLYEIQGNSKSEIKAQVLVKF